MSEQAVQGATGQESAPAEGSYAGARVPRPSMPSRRYRMPRRAFRFYPLLQDEAQHPRSWDFPSYLDSSVPWVAALRDLYLTPESFPASFSPEAGLLLHALIRN